MQVLFEFGVEHGVTTAGCGEWPGRRRAGCTAPILPHMGWNTVEVGDGSQLFRGVENERFYFVHSYAVRRWEMPPSPRLLAPILTWTEHGEPFLAAVENGALMATQFHPEKSGMPGQRCCRTGSRRCEARARAAARRRRRRRPGRPPGPGRRRVGDLYGDPLEAALAWQASAEWMHLVDLDAAFGRGSNRELLAKVVGALDVDVELSGGIRDDASLDGGHGDRLPRG